MQETNLTYCKLL